MTEHTYLAAQETITKHALCHICAAQMCEVSADRLRHQQKYHQLVAGAVKLRGYYTRKRGRA